MMPIKYTIKHAQEQRTIDIEELGGLLEYHRRSIEIGNAFSSDSGSRWDCKLSNTENYEDNFIEASAPSLRTAILDALDELLEFTTKVKSKEKLSN